MTTKIKIITGFAFLMVLLAGISVVGYQSVNQALNDFSEYQAEAGTAVAANSVDALVREGKFKVNSFIISLEPAILTEMDKDLARIDTYMKDAIRLEPNAENKRELEVQYGNIKKIAELAATLQRDLLAADKLMQDSLNPAAARINELLTPINKNAMDTGNTDLFHTVDAAYTTLMDMRIFVRAYMATYLPRDAEKARALFKDFERIVSDMKQHASISVQSSVRELEDNFKKYTETFKACEELAVSGMKASTAIDETAAALDSYFTDYTVMAEANMHRVGAETLQHNESAELLMATGGAVGSLLGLAFAVWIVLGVVRVLTRVSSFAYAVAHGDFSQEITVREKGEIGNMVDSIKLIPDVLRRATDEARELTRKIGHGNYRARIDTTAFQQEFAALTGMFNAVSDSYTEVLDVVPVPIMACDKNLNILFLNKPAQGAVGGDKIGDQCADYLCAATCGNDKCLGNNTMRTKAAYTDETVINPKVGRMEVSVTATPLFDENNEVVGFIELLTDLTEIKDKQNAILRVAEQASTISNRVAAASEELSAQVEQVSRGAEMQRSRVESTASAMTEMNSTVLEVARSAGQASEQSEQTRQKADDGSLLVNRVVQAIHAVNTVTSTLHANMQELGVQAESIGGVMNVISDIADQTNLLALNAAIEAARAGEAGRGFAVVADEVRKLAEKTMQATQEVGGSITSIQNSARSNIGSVEEASKSVTEATELVNSSGEALKEIVDLASASSALVASIATAAEEQSATSEEINLSIEEINHVVGETTEGMVQASAAVQELSHMAQELNRVMEELK